jgi:hypothetical protein
MKYKVFTNSIIKFKTMSKTKLITLTLISAVLFTSCNETKETEVVEKKVETVDVSAETEAVAQVMKSYKDAMQNLTTDGTM